MKANTLVKVVVFVAIVAAAVYGVIYTKGVMRARAEKQASVCLRQYYKAVGKGQPDAAAQEQIAKLLPEMEALTPKCGENVRESLITCRLDGAFLIGDYAKAESMMDIVPGKSPEWKQAAKAKVRAHAAQVKGDKATAAAEYLKFVELILADKAEMLEVDPYTGAEWTKDGVVARNYLRISQLLSDVGRKDEAAKYRAEAKKYFDEARKHCADDAESKKALEEACADLLK